MLELIEEPKTAGVKVSAESRAVAQRFMDAADEYHRATDPEVKAHWENECHMILTLQK